MAESSNNPVDALLGLIQSQLLDVNTCLPATIVSYENGIARVSPTGKKRFADGDALDYPIIPNVRICWPSFSGGMAGIKGPVKKGDSCLLVFSQQAVDGSDDRRMFDLQDAYAIMCNIGTAGKSDSINNADMTMYFGPAYIRLTEGGELMINAPGGTTIKTPSTHNTGTLTTDGLLTYKDGMTGTGGGAGTNITGTITQSGGTLSSNGIVLHKHTHGGVQTGGGNTGAPQ
jgi:hypothetical protein